MENKEKLIEILKTVPEIKKDLEELRFGSHISWKDKNSSWNDDIVTIVKGEFFATRYTGIKEKRTNIPYYQTKSKTDTGGCIV